MSSGSNRIGSSCLRMRVRKSV